MIKFLMALASAAMAFNVQAIVVTGTADANSLAASLAGSGVVISNASLSSDTEQPAGTFTGGADSVGFANGIVLTTGTTDCVPGPNVLEDCTGSGISTSLKFDFTSETGFINFRYVFGSEEYNEFVGEGFSDSFELLLNGVNIALLPNGAGVVSIDNVNCGTNPEFYVNNAQTVGSCVGQNLDIEYDGLTKVLTASASVTAGALNTFEFKVFDVGDDQYDSGVFFEAGSFSGTPIPEPTSLALAGLGVVVLLGRRRRQTN